MSEGQNLIRFLIFLEGRERLGKLLEAMHQELVESLGHVLHSRGLLGMVPQLGDRLPREPEQAGSLPCHLLVVWHGASPFPSLSLFPDSYNGCSKLCFLGML